MDIFLVAATVSSTINRQVYEPFGSEPMLTSAEEYPTVVTML